MYEYKLEKRYYEDQRIEQLYKDYFKRVYPQMLSKFKNRRFLFFVVAEFGDEPVGCMGIDQADYGSGRVFKYDHLVVHPGHRRKGVAKNIIINSVALLKSYGVLNKIVNHKSENVIPHRIFEDLGFVKVDFRTCQMLVEHNH